MYGIIQRLSIGCSKDEVEEEDDRQWEVGGEKIKKYRRRIKRNVRDSGSIIKE